MKRLLQNPQRARNLLPLFGALAFTASASFGNVPDENPGNTAKNLARMNCGAQIECTTPDGHVADVATADGDNQSAAALIMDDETLSCPLQEGQTTFVIKLPTTSLLDRFTFVNENAAAAGELKISVSNYRLPATSPKWVEVDGSIAFTRKRLFNLSILGVEARYVKLSFNVEKAGRIASLGLYGGETLERFALRHQERENEIAWISNTVGGRSPALEDKLNFNFANVYAKAHVVQVSSGSMASARRMIDDDNQTGYRFAESDPRPTVIVELAGSQRLRRVSALYKLRVPGRLDVYLLNDVSKGPTGLNDQPPVASVKDENGEGKAAVDFDAQGARYVAIQWTPASSTVGENSFEIAEIDAFGDMPLAMLQLSGAPDLYASSLNRVQFPGEGGTYLSSSLGTLAILPVLPLVSP